jgi:uncharacterized protein (DUF1501 family)
MADKDPVLAVVVLDGGNDGMNTVIPYANPRYRDRRPRLGIPEDQIIPFTDELGFHPSFAPMKKYWDEGKLAILLGIGYPNPSLSHFRSMDIWGTCEPDTMAQDGWLGRTIKAIDPTAENVLTGVNFGRGLPLALAMEGVPVASVGDLSKYGLLTDIKREKNRNDALDLFGRMYAPRIGQGQVDDFIRRTGIEALKGADILATAPGKYQSEIEYTYGNIGEYLRDIVQVHNAGFGTQVLFTSTPYNVFDHHANQAVAHSALLHDVATNIDTFMTDLCQQNISDNIVTLLYSEFGRRANDNGSGTDHGTGGISFVIGEQVKGGIYGEYPSLKPEDLQEGGNLQYNLDFRSAYTTILEGWLGLDAKPIVGGAYEHLGFL